MDVCKYWLGAPSGWQPPFSGSTFRLTDTILWQPPLARLSILVAISLCLSISGSVSFNLIVFHNQKSNFPNFDLSWLKLLQHWKTIFRRQFFKNVVLIIPWDSGNNKTLFFVEKLPSKDCFSVLRQFSSILNDLFENLILV